MIKLNVAVVYFKACEIQKMNKKLIPEKVPGAKITVLPWNYESLRKNIGRKFGLENVKFS